jgi:hypothetical protein
VVRGRAIVLYAQTRILRASRPRCTSRSAVRLIGAVNTAMSSYPMKLLQSKVLPTRCEWRSYVHRRDGTVAPKALVWVDRERRYFISTASSVVESAKY